MEDVGLLRAIRIEIDVPSTFNPNDDGEFGGPPSCPDGTSGCVVHDKTNVVTEEQRLKQEHSTKRSSKRHKKTKKRHHRHDDRRDDNDRSGSDSSSSINSEETNNDRYSKRRRKRHRSSSDNNRHENEDCTSRSQDNKEKKNHKKDKKKKKKRKQCDLESELDRMTVREKKSHDQSIVQLPATTEIVSIPYTQVSKQNSNDTSNVDDPDLLHSRKKSMIPMTREEYEAQQSQIRHVFDAESGRVQLVRGTGEIIESIVSKTQHSYINQLATRSDGHSFTRHVMTNAMHPTTSATATITRR
jgi:Nuclear RNA-splicing-associated protein